MIFGDSYFFRQLKPILLHMLILKGETAASETKQNLRNQAAAFTKTNGYRKPHLAAILAGNNAASETYVASKVKNCEEVGFESTLIRLDENVSEKELLIQIEELNSDIKIDGILVQLPLPAHINESKIISAIHPDKDVDGFHPLNAGKLVQGLKGFVPATPLGITLMLQFYGIETKGKHAVIIGRSNIVGRPMSILLSSNAPYGNCTVTLCHSGTKNLEAITRQADILVAALGQPAFIKKEMIKPGAVVVDVGISRVEDSAAKKGYVIKGDVDFEAVSSICSAITPVPGGVGLMTIAGLLQNTWEAYLLQFEKISRRLN